MSATGDLKAIRKFRDKAPANSALKRVLTEALEASHKVLNYVQQQSSGYVICFYDTHTNEPLRYQVNYQPGNLGNLAHELTHVACNEAYGQDFVNYPCFHAARTAPVYDGQGRRTNENTRQDEWRDAARETRKSMLEALSGQARALDFGSVQVKKVYTDSAGHSTTVKVPEDRTKEITDKLEYGISKPHIEFDTVVNQILVWLGEWGYPKKGAEANLGFYAAVENAVKIAWHMRRAGAPRHAPVPALGAEDDG